MICPVCASKALAVEVRNGESLRVRRRYKCTSLSCAVKFSTLESVVTSEELDEGTRKMLTTAIELLNLALTQTNTTPVIESEDEDGHPYDSD